MLFRRFSGSSFQREGTFSDSWPGDSIPRSSRPPFWKERLSGLSFLVQLWCRLVKYSGITGSTPCARQPSVWPY